MFVYPERMRENLDMLKGMIFSGQLLLDLVEKGALREEAYRWVQRNAMQVWETREDYRTLVERDPDIRRYLKPNGDRARLQRRAVSETRGRNFQAGVRKGAGLTLAAEGGQTSLR